MDSVNSACEEKMKKALEALKHEFNGVRTGRASPTLLDKIRVEYYGQKTPLARQRMEWRRLRKGWLRRNSPRRLPRG